MATMFVTGHSVDERTMELELGIWREMGRKCKWRAGARGNYSVSAFVLQDAGVPYFSCSAPLFEWDYQVFMLHRLLESSVLVLTGSERGDNSLSLSL